MAKKTIRITAQPGPQWDFLATEADICVYGGAAGGGKAQPLSEMVLTPFGYRPMGSLTVGAKVVSAKGRTATVIQVHPQGKKPVFKVTFIDGAQVRCTADHLWLASEARKRSKLKHRNGWKIYTTERLISEVAKGKNMLVPLCEPVQFTRGKRGGVIKPYTLGVILGDGSTTGDMITVTGNDPEIFKNVQDEGYRLKEYVAPGEGKAGCYSFQDFSKERRWLSSQSLRCRAEYKHIPDGYKYAPIHERYRLLQGLMDTDGYADNRGHCEFCTTSLQLAKDVQWLVWSLGGKATITEKEPSCVFPDGTRKKCRTAYLVYIRTRDNSKLFGIERKRKRCGGKLYNGGHGELKRRILSIEPDGEEECQCITIDETDGLYVTKDFVVTHNSYALLLSALMYKNVRGFNCTIFRRTFKQVFSPGGLWDTAHSIYGPIHNAQMHKATTSWEFVDKAGEAISKVTFAHIEGYNGVDDWQGSQLCEICCEVDTPVLMGDGRYKKVSDLKVGDCVQTLNGVWPVTAVGKERLGECVDVMVDGVHQVQTTDHKLLTDKGWVSYEDIIRKELDTFYCSLESILSHYHCRCGESSSMTCSGAYRRFENWCLGPERMPEQHGRHLRDTDILSLCEHTVCGLLRLLNDESTQCCFGEGHDGCFRQNILKLQRLLCSQCPGRTQGCEAFPENQDCQGLSGTCAYTAQQGQESDSESSESKRRELLRHVLSRLQQVLDEQPHQSPQGNGRCGSGHDESSCVPNGTQAEDCQYCYCACRGLCDECVHLVQDTCQGNARQLSGVVIHTPNGSHLCGKDKIQEDSRHVLRYNHPYIESLHLEAEERVSYRSLKMSPCGVRKVRTFTVCAMNQYITKHGFVNKNCFDELTHFDAPTFFYMLSRNRSTCGVKPFIRATCNPDADSWVAKFIEWWINDETGYPIPERSGVLRWFVRRDGILYWADTREELWKQFNLVTEEEKDEPRSVTFIMSSIYDNKELLKVNPQYLSSLKALPEVERERLLNGNWKIKPSAGMFFKRSQVGEFIQIIPKDVVTWVRCWDLAATEKDDNGDAAYTAGVLIGKRKNGRYIIADVINKQIAASEVRTLIRHTAQLDRAKYKRVRIRLPQDPGQAGKEQAQSYIKWLSGFDVTTVTESGSKEARAEPMAAQWQAGNFDIIIADWNDAYLSQLENFPEGKYKDMVDASANGFAEVELKSQFNVGNLL